MGRLKQSGINVYFDSFSFKDGDINPYERIKFIGLPEARNSEIDFYYATPLMSRRSHIQPEA